MTATEHDRSFALAVAAHGLAARDDARSRPLEPVGFDDLLTVALRERMTGLLCRAIDDGAISASGEQRERARRAHEDALIRDLRLERLLARTSELLAHEGIAHCALKGPVLARTAYDAPELRSFADVDVLVERDGFDHAIRVLVEGGGTRRFGEPRTGFAARYTKGVCVDLTDGCQVDVHVSLAAGPFGLSIPVDELLASPDAVEVGATRVPALRVEHRFLHACYHAALGDEPPRLVPLRDVAEMARRGLDADAVLTIAARWRGLAVVQRALLLVGATLGVRIPEPLGGWSRSHRPPRVERVALQSSLPSSGGYGRQAAAGLLLLRGARARMRYARALLLPDRAYLDERDGSYARRWRRAVGLARGKGR